MVRAPCCEKKGLKRGLWTPEEDHILMSYIQTHGHDNWRALPKQAGLQRCGKSCRLRWVNYLRPDIKRGNITTEEEETIIKLHQILGNRWSAIAARLPGRTDNEIKNVWHTYLKKHHKTNYRCSHNPNQTATSDNMLLGVGKNAGTPDSLAATEAWYEGSGGGCCSTSPQHSSCSAELLSLTATDSWECSVSLPRIDECLQPDNPTTMAVLPSACEGVPERANCSNSDRDCDVGFWYNLYLRAGELAATESGF